MRTPHILISHTGRSRRGSRYNGTTYVVYSTGGTGYITHIRVEVTFKPQAANGLIFYSSQYRNGSGSYLLAQLQNYQFFLGLDAGAGPVTIRYISFYPALETNELGDSFVCNRLLVHLIPNNSVLSHHSPV